MLLWDGALLTTHPQGLLYSMRLWFVILEIQFYYWGYLASTIPSWMKSVGCFTKNFIILRSLMNWLPYTAWWIYHPSAFSPPSCTSLVKSVSETCFLKACHWLLYIAWKKFTRQWQFHQAPEPGEFDHPRKPGKSFTRLSKTAFWNIIFSGLWNLRVVN